MKNSHMPDAHVSITVPVYNEERCLAELVSRCVAAAQQTGRSWELILIDDGSVDRSPALIRQAVADHPDHVRGVLLNRNYGQHSALLAGFEHARGEIVITLDADLQNPPEEIPRLVKKLEEGFDVVGTIRLNRQDSFFRRLASSAINYAVRKSTGVAMHDYGCMLRAYRRSIIDAVLSCTERSTFIPVLANSFAQSTAEIEVTHAERTTGKSKYSLLKLISLQFDLVTGMTTFPLRLLSITGALISAAGMSFGLLLFVLRLVYGPEWAGGGVFTLFAILFFFVGAQFVAMGLLGEYIGRVYIDVRARPRYFVAETLGGQHDARFPQRVLSSASSTHAAPPPSSSFQSTTAQTHQSTPETQT